MRDCEYDSPQPGPDHWGYGHAHDPVRCRRRHPRRHIGGGGLVRGRPWQAALAAPGRGSWQYLLTWVGFYAVCAINVLLLLMDWDAWVFPSPLRFIAGVPLVVLGGLLALWGVVTAGYGRTRFHLGCLKGGFVSAGPYRFTRNPQYLGDIRLLRWAVSVLVELGIAVDHALASFSVFRGYSAGRGAVAGGAVRGCLPGVSAAGATVSLRGARG